MSLTTLSEHTFRSGLDGLKLCWTSYPLHHADVHNPYPYVNMCEGRWWYSWANFIFTNWHVDYLLTTDDYYWDMVGESVVAMPCQPHWKRYSAHHTCSIVHIYMTAVMELYLPPHTHSIAHMQISKVGIVVHGAQPRDKTPTQNAMTDSNLCKINMSYGY